MTRRKTTSRNRRVSENQNQRGRRGEFNRPIIASPNHQRAWEAYEALRSQVERAWGKLHSDVRQRASAETIFRDRNDLLLLLGECDYMARECMHNIRAETRPPRRKSAR